MRWEGVRVRGGWTDGRMDVTGVGGWDGERKGGRQGYCVEGARAIKKKGGGVRASEERGRERASERDREAQAQAQRSHACAHPRVHADVDADAYARTHVSAHSRTHTSTHYWCTSEYMMRRPIR